MPKFDNKNIIYKLKSKLHNLDYLPRWIILCIDIFVVFFCIIITYLMMLRVGMYYINPVYLKIGIFLLVFTHFLFLVFFRIYAGIIRHSSFIDGIKLFISEFSTFLALFFINHLLILFYDIKILLNTGLFLNSILVFSSLFVYRIIVKHIFDKYLKDSHSNSLIRVMVPMRTQFLLPMPYFKKRLYAIN